VRRVLQAGSALLWLACAGPRPAWEEPPPPARDAPLVAPGSLLRVELENGLHVIVLEDHRLPRVSLGLELRRGEASVPPAQAGLAVFTAELLERGAGARDALALAEAVDEVGASLGAGADWDSMGIQVAGLRRDQGRLLEILADVALRPRFEAAEASKARAEMLAALERAMDRPETLVGWNLLRTLYGTHRFGLPLSGQPESVTRLDAAQARALHRELFVPGNAIFFASGDVEAGALLEQVRALFGAWPRGPVPGPGLPPPSPAPPERRIVLVDRPELEQTHIALAHEGITRADPERVAAGLLDTVLGGGGFSSRLMATVRAEQGLVYGIGSSFALRRAGGPFSVQTSTRVEATRRVIDLVLGELERARREPPSEEELADARMLEVGSFALGLETSDAVVASLVDLDVQGLPDDSLDTFRTRVRATRRDEVARLAQKLLHPERAAIVLVGPAAVLRPQLEGLGPVEVVQP
jgi:predicted Zn-dependent peptidase